MHYPPNQSIVPNDIRNYKDKNEIHNNSELRSIYNAIIRVNQQSPYYMLQYTLENQIYALRLKDSAIALRYTLEKYKNNREDSVFHLQKIVSSNGNVVSAVILENGPGNLPNEFTIKVNHLATSQINVGYEIKSSNKSLKSGLYSFMVSIEENLYEFQFNVQEKTTNKENLTKLANFINKSNTGIKASITNNIRNNTCQIVLKSVYTGATKDLTFTFEDKLSADDSRGIIEYFGLNNVKEAPTNSSFELNGEEKVSLSSHFTYNRSVDIHLNSVSEEVVFIGFTKDTEKILERLDTVINSYNKVVSLSTEYSLLQKRTNTLIYELNYITNDYKNELESCGITLNEKKELIIDQSITRQAIDDGDIENLLTGNYGYTNKLQNKMLHIMLNPMEYLDKTIVTYPNTSRISFTNPYITSIYSGMLYNYFC